MSVSPTASSLAPELHSEVLNRVVSNRCSSRDDRAATLLGWSALVLILAVGVPIFLCMPVSFDISHYDICSRSLLQGGVHYRDTFDNNLPGIVWLQAGIRWLIGWRSESLHAIDLLFFSIDVVLLLPWVRRGARIWTAAALYAFYLFLPEPCPCQRDIWMFLPAVVGLTLRRRQVERLSRPASTVFSIVGAASLEGLCWGTAVWIKPFVFVPGLACWLVSLLQVRKARPGRNGLLIADLLGLLAGGMFIGALGLLVLWRSGSWPYFWEILLVWNRDYGAVSQRLDVRFCNLGIFLFLFLPWSLAPCAAVYFAVAALRRELAGGKAPVRPSEPIRPRVALLAAFFLGWLFQAVFFQLTHQYVLSVTVIPALVLIAALYQWQELSLIPATMRMCCVVLLALVWTMAFQFERLPLWARCCCEGSTPELKSLLGMRKGTAYTVDAKPLADVERYLVSQNARDGEVTCMSGCTHPLYLDLNLKPSTRFPQVEMTCLFFTKHTQEVLAELNASHQRFIVSDLVWTGLTPEEAAETNPADPLALPREFPDKFALTYPWNEPVVFRSGRYVVQRATGPASRFWRENPIYGSDAKNEYMQKYSADLSFHDEEAARQSVAVIDDLYKRSQQTGDPAGRHEARIRALTMFDQARAAGKEREADLFWRWLAGIKDE
jgi:hypothetical protein